MATKKKESQYLQLVTKIDAPYNKDDSILKMLTDAGCFLVEVVKPLAGRKDGIHYYEVYERIEEK